MTVVSAAQPARLSDRRLKAAAEALEKRRDDIAVFVKWPALQASLAAEAAMLRADMRQPREECDELDRLILDSVKRTGTIEAARSAAQRRPGEDRQRVLERRVERLRKRLAIRFVAGRWEEGT